MKVLLTIEEYKERIIKLVMDVANKTINPNGDDYFKFEFISWLVKECLTDNFHCVDWCNRMYINTFGRDRNGKLWRNENMSQIDEKEAVEFNLQEWYAKFNEAAIKSYDKQYYMCDCTEGYGLDEVDNRIYIEEVVSAYFLENTNEAYYLSLEIFKKLYGYEYKIDRDFKCE
jgi:hypothetical protein